MKEGYNGQKVYKKRKQFKERLIKGKKRSQTGELI